MASSTEMMGWELTALFLVFLFITLFWDFLVGCLTFLNNILRGRKANWLARVKDELLALGVVSLVLLFLEPSLQQICMPGSKSKYAGAVAAPSPPPEYGTYNCDAGRRQVFPKTVIHAAHYLLFYLAIVHILFSLLTSVITNIKLAKWSALERTARKEQNIPAVAFLRISSVIARANDPATFRPSIRLRETWRDFIGFVDQDLYSLLRFMCEKRFRAHSVALRNFNFLNMCEQCLEAELNEVYSHAWLLVFMMALLLLYNRRVYQMAWMAFLCVAMMALMAGNLRWVMKKTAREARNLWRNVQGMGGLERDDDEEGDEVGPVGVELVATEGPLGRGSLALQLRQQQQQQYAIAMAAAAGGAGGAGLGGMEAGDVGGAQRMDQLPVGSHGPRRSSAKLLHFASVPRQGAGPGPVGESLECSTDQDPAAAAEPPVGVAAAAAAAQPGWGCAAGAGGSWDRCRAGGSASWGHAGATPVGCGPPHKGGLVDLLEACRGVRAAAALNVAESGGDGGQANHNRRSSRSSGLDRSHGGGSGHRGEPWWEPCAASEPQRRRRPGCAAAGAAAPAAAARPGTSGTTVSVIWHWLGLLQPRRPLGTLSGGGKRAAVGFGNGGGGGRLSGTGGFRKRLVGRAGRRQGAGPVGEGTISNPLYAVAADATTGGGGFGYGGAHFAMSTSEMYGTGAGAGGMYGTGAGAGGMYGSGGGGFGVSGGPPGMMQFGMAAASPYLGGGGGASLIAAAAAAPYGSSAGFTAATTAPQPPSPLLPQAATVVAAAAVDGQWGSNPSSGSPEEGEVEDSASTGSGSGSGSTGSGAERRLRAHGKGAAAAGGKDGAEEDDDDDVHSEKSMMEHQLASGIEEKITRLFFFGRPFLLLWFFNIIFAQASLTMTMSMAFVIPYDKFDYIRDVAMPMYIWLPVVLTNLILVFYGCWVFLPQYALLSVCGILEPHEVMDTIKRSKTADKVEEGISGLVLETLTDYFVGRHDGETRLSTAFIVTLAGQAGIILGRDYKAQRHINKEVLKPMYKEFVLVWHDIAWYGELKSTYRLKSVVNDFQHAFDELDEDGSGALSFGELANMIRSLGTYATTGDVEAMLWEIDIDNSNSIGYDEFVKFMVYAFFDTRQLGYLDKPAVVDGMERLGIALNEMQVTVLMSVGNCEPDEEPKVTLRQFFGMFEKVVFEEEDAEEEEDAAAAASRRMASVVGRAREILSSPSSLFLGLRSGSAIRKQDSGGSLSVPISGRSGHGGGDGTSLAGSSSRPSPVSGGGLEGVRAKLPSRLAVVTKP